MRDDYEKMEGIAKITTPFMKGVLYMIKEDAKICPNCNGLLKHYDHVTRKIRSEYGKIEQRKIRRFKCVECGKVHRELPKNLMPYKQFTTEIITGVIEGSITPECLEYEDYPCELTMKRWIDENRRKKRIF